MKVVHEDNEVKLLAENEEEINILSKIAVDINTQWSFQPEEGIWTITLEDSGEVVTDKVEEEVSLECDNEDCGCE